MLLPEPGNGILCFLIHFFIPELRAQCRPQCPILAVDFLDLIQPPKLNGWNPQSLLKIPGSKSCFRIQNQVEVCLCHTLIFVIILAPGNLPDFSNANALE